MRTWHHYSWLNTLVSNRINRFFIHDIPGHGDFIKNASTYIALADVAILIVSAGLGEFEVSVTKHEHERGMLGGMVRTHAQKYYAVGVKPKSKS